MINISEWSLDGTSLSLRASFIWQYLFSGLWRSVTSSRVNSRQSVAYSALRGASARWLRICISSSTLTILQPPILPVKQSAGSYVSGSTEDKPFEVFQYLFPSAIVYVSWLFLFCFAIGVTVECVGKCEVNWTEETRREVNGQTETETIVHYDSENYFYHRIVLQGNGNAFIDHFSWANVFLCSANIICPSINSMFGNGLGCIQLHISLVLQTCM